MLSIPGSSSSISQTLQAPEKTFPSVLGGPTALQSMGPLVAHVTHRKSRWHLSHYFSLSCLLPITSRISPSWLRHRKSPPSGLCMGFPSGSVLKNLPASAGDLGSTPGSGRSLGEGNGYPLQYSSLENSMDRGAWWATAHGVAKSQTQLSH